VSERIDTVRTVEAPEGVELALHVAGPYPRALAYVLDFMLRNSITSVLSVFALAGSVGWAVILLTMFVLEWFYPVVFELTMQGATPGKRVLGLRVLRDDGTPVGWRESVLRNMLSAVDFLPGLWGAGFISMLLSRDGKRLGDRVAGTLVVYVARHETLRNLPAAEPLHPPVALTLEEQSALVEFAARKPSWSDARAAELAGHLAGVTGESGAAGVDKLLGLAVWVEGGR